MVRTAPIAVETGTLFFGAFTGAAKMLARHLRRPLQQVHLQRARELRRGGARDGRVLPEAGVPDARHFVSFDPPPRRFTPVQVSQ